MLKKYTSEWVITIFISQNVSISFIILANSSKSISPFPSLSTSLMTSSHTLSSIFYPEQSSSFTSIELIVPLPSLSNRLKAAFSLSGDNKFSLLIVATTHSIRLNCLIYLNNQFLHCHQHRPSEVFFQLLLQPYLHIFSYTRLPIHLCIIYCLNFYLMLWILL